MSQEVCFVSRILRRMRHFLFSTPGILPLLIGVATGDINLSAICLRLFLVLGLTRTYNPAKGGKYWRESQVFI